MTKPAAFEAVSGAVEKIAGDRGAAELEAEQLTLLPTRSNLTPAQKARVDAAVRANRRGRPPGAQNLATREMLDFIRKTIGDPMLESARMAMHTPETLSIELGCSKFEAAELLEKIRSDLRPYFYAKQAPVDADGKPAPWLTMTFGDQNARPPGLAAPGQPPWAYLDVTPNPPQQNQEVSAEPGAQSHGEVSHGDE